MAQASGSSKGRKFGRNRDRSPAMKSYRNQNRMAINKAKKIMKHVKQVHKDATKVMKVARGTARAKRRGSFH